MDKPKKITEFGIDIAKNYPLSSTKKKDLDLALATFIVEDQRPIKIVRGKGFQRLMHKLDPRYQIPSIKTIREGRIPKIKDQEKGRLKQELSKTESVALTTDLWSSITMTTFMSVTAHYMSPPGSLQARLLDCSSFHSRHTAKNIKDRLLHVIKNFEIQDRVNCICSDSAANMKKAISETGLEGLPCFAHNLNLAVSGAIKSCESLEKVRQKIVSLVTFMHQSCNGKEDFNACLSRLNLPKKVLIQDVKKRWNSVFLMLERFLELKEAVVLFQSTESGQKFSFIPEDWKIAEEAKNLLLPVYEATKEISGDSYVSGSKVIPIASSLLWWYSDKANKEREQEPFGFGATLSALLQESFLKYFKDAEAIDILAIATLCDPRYKQEGFRTETSCNLALGKLKEQMRLLETDSVTEEEEPNAPAPMNPTGESGSSFWSYLDSKVRKKPNQPTTSHDENESIIMNEVSKYLKLINLDRKEDPLGWWKSTGQTMFPKLYSVAQKFLIIPGTSVPSERVFSTAGSIITKKRNRLSDDMAADFIFLAENLSKKKKTH